MLQGGFIMAQNRRLELEANIHGHYRSTSSTIVTYLASKVTEISEKCKIRAITPFKVIKVHMGLPISD